LIHGKALVWRNTGEVRNVVAVLLIGASGFALAACGGAHITVITGPTTTTIAHPTTGHIIRCKANGSRLRAKIPASGEVKKGIEGSTGGSTGPISLALIRRPDGSVVVSCTR
jgi:hypothetical protein